MDLGQAIGGSDDLGSAPLTNVDPNLITLVGYQHHPPIKAEVAI